MQTAIETVGLGKRYGDFQAVSDLDLAIPQGSVFGLLGPNGAGKTTAMMMLLGIIRPSSGRAVVLGESAGSVAVRSRIGFLPEKFQFHDFLTTTEFLRLHAKLAGMRRRDFERRVTETLELVGLADRGRSRIRELSKGMQQRIGLAQALLGDPELIILDEPTSALDPLGRRDVRDIVLDLHNRGKTVILNSHLLSEIEMTCDRVAIIKKGRVAMQGSIDELLGFSSTVDLQVEGMTDAAMAALRDVAAKIKMIGLGAKRLTVWVRSVEDVPHIARAIVENGADLLALVPRRESLEELFMRVIEGAPSA